MVNNREEPGLDAPSSLHVAASMTPRAEEGVLEDILGKRRVAGDAESDRIGHDSVPVIQRFQCVQLAVRNAREDLPIVVVDGRDRPARSDGVVRTHRFMRTDGAFGSLA